MASLFFSTIVRFMYKGSTCVRLAVVALMTNRALPADYDKSYFWGNLSE